MQNAVCVPGHMLECFLNSCPLSEDKVDEQIFDISELFSHKICRVTYHNILLTEGHV